MSLPERSVLVGEEKANLIRTRKKLDNRSLVEQTADKPQKNGGASDPLDIAISEYLLTGEPDDPGKRLDLLSTDEGRMRLIYYPLLDALMKQESLEVNAKKIKSGKRGESDRSRVVSYGLKSSIDGEDIEISAKPGEGKLSFTSRKNLKEGQQVDAFDLTPRELAWVSLSSACKNINTEISVKKNPDLAQEEGVFRLIDLTNSFLKAVGETGR